MLRLRPAARGVLALIVTLIAQRSAHAQNVGAGSQPSFGALMLSTGMAMMSVDALNARMTSSQFAGLSNDAVSYGVSGRFAYSRALIGAEFNRSAYGEEGLNNGRTDDLSSVQGAITVGYAVLSTTHLSIFPEVGAGLGMVNVVLRDRNGVQSAAVEPSFDEIAQTPGPESTLSAKALLYSFGGGADYLIAPRGARKGVVFGLRAGVLASPNRAIWTRGGQSVSAGPDVGPGGRYLRLMVGLGGR